MTISIGFCRPMSGPETYLPRSWRYKCRDSESEVEYIEPDSTPLQTETRAQQLLCPPVVAQTRPMEGCAPALHRRLRRGRDVLTEDGAVAVDTEQVSTASDTVVFKVKNQQFLVYSTIQNQQLEQWGDVMRRC